MILHSNVISEGKPFIILHGFLGMSDNWKSFGLKMSQNGYQMHLVDQRNHGRSFHDLQFNYEVMVNDLLAYCNAKGLNKIILLGHSMGGKAAMLFACKFPELVSKLIVADISPRFYPIHHDQILNGLSTLDFLEIKSRSQADEVLSSFISEVGVRQFLLKNLYWISPGQLALRINLEVLKNEVSEVGEALDQSAHSKVLALFLKGDRSEYVTTSDFEIIKGHFPNSKIETVSNAGHWLHAENPDMFYDKVLKFIY